MCGIAGIVNAHRAEIGASVLVKMLECLRHRGPDAEGLYHDDHVVLAHTRLSIIDLQSGGQPMSTSNKSLWITFNGEIFNYVELRETLARQGHQFATQSDTEVILHLYEEKGESCVEDMNGQWAFGIWDRQRSRLFLSRDRLGVRPLFYAVNRGMLVFGSEIKAVMTVPAVRREVDPIALDQVFTVWNIIPPRTFFKGISELPAGHSLIYENGRVRTWCYWRPSFAFSRGSSSEAASTDEERAEQLRHLLADATRIRLRADVPVGAYLSGGLDSTLIVALVRKFTDKRLKTFSVAFEDSEFDESEYQRVSATSLNTEHHEFRCRPRDIGKVFPRVMWHIEKPTLWTAPAPLFLLSKRVQEAGLKVVLTGEGSDEMFGGYDIFKETKIRRLCALRPRSHLWPALLRELYPFHGRRQVDTEEYVKRFFRVGECEVNDPCFSHLARWQMLAPLKGVIFSEEILRAIGDYDAVEEIKGQMPEVLWDWEWLDRAQYVEIMTNLTLQLLASQGDRMAMAHGVEGRFPFLDYRVVEFAATMQGRSKLRALDEKYLLKKAAKGLIPDSVLRRRKQPYRAPQAASFFGHGEDDSKRPEYIAEALSERALKRDGLFHAGAMSKLVERMTRGQIIGTRDNMLWVGVLSAQLAVEQFVNQLGPRWEDG